jgi:hypothetical protein
MARPDIVQRAKIAVRRAEACRLRVAGYTYAQIAERLGYSSEKFAQVDVKRALKVYVDLQQEPIEELRARELAALDGAQQVATEVMGRDHLAHSNGRVVMIEDEQTGEVSHVKDDGPKLAAIDRVVKISESRRKLLGQDAPSKVDTTVTGTTEYVIKIDAGEMEQL